MALNAISFLVNVSIAMVARQLKNTRYMAMDGALY